MWKRSTSSCAGIVARVSSPQRASRWASSAWRTREALGRDRPGRALDGCSASGTVFGRGGFGRLALVRARGRGRARRATSSHELGRRERPRASVLAEHPDGEQVEVGVRRREDAVLDLAALDHALDPPGGVGVELDLAPRPWPRRTATAGGRGSRTGRSRPACGSRARGAWRSGCRRRMRETRNVRSSSCVEVAADHVPGARLRQERVRVDRALARAVARDRPVA